MKKLIAILICLCVVLALFAGCGQSTIEAYDEDDAVGAADTAGQAAEEEPSAAEAAVNTAEPDPNVPVETEDTAADTPAGVNLGGTGYGTYAPDTIVGTVNGTDVTWMEYYYWLRYYAQYVEDYVAQYGLVLDGWDAYELSADETNGQVVIMNAQMNLIQDHAIQTETAKMGVGLTEEDEATIQSVLEQNADGVTGDGDGTATEEEIAAFEQYLADEMFVDVAFFNQFNATALLSQRGFEAASGEMGELLSDEETLAFAEENGLMGAKHILLLTVDPTTGESLTEEEIAGKKALAEDLNAQLQAVKDDQEAMITLFDELTEKYTEDTGYASYPDGYVFGEGEMVQAFENAVKELDENYGLSEIVESEYGYHIILRIPVTPDAIIGTDSAGNDVTLRYVAATQLFSDTMQSWIEEADVQWNEGFETPDLTAIFG